MTARLTRIERWELDHLRELVAIQQAQIDAQSSEIAALNDRVIYAESCADHWHDMAMDNLNGNGLVPGLTPDGNVIALRPL